MARRGGDTCISCSIGAVAGAAAGGTACMHNVRSKTALTIRRASGCVVALTWYIYRGRIRRPVADLPELWACWMAPCLAGLDSRAVTTKVTVVVQTLEYFIFLCREFPTLSGPKHHRHCGMMPNRMTHRSWGARWQGMVNARFHLCRWFSGSQPRTGTTRGWRESC